MAAPRSEWQSGVGWAESVMRSPFAVAGLVAAAVHAVAVLAPVPSVAALATVVVLDKIIVRRQVHEAPSLLQSPRQLMLLS